MNLNFLVRYSGETQVKNNLSIYIHDRSVDL